MQARRKFFFTTTTTALKLRIFPSILDCVYACFLWQVNSTPLCWLQVIDLFLPWTPKNASHH